MGLLDKAKSLVEGHKDQIQHGLDKAKQTVNRASESINQSVSKRLPNAGTMTPVGQPEPGPSVGDEVDRSAPTGEGVPMAPTPEAEEPSVAPPRPPVAEGGESTNP
jgi:MT0933-like antitoxin protein